MRLQIILGYPDQKPASVPFPVYVGRDAAAADQAMASSPAARFEIFRNPAGGIRKNNSRAAANAEAEEKLFAEQTAEAQAEWNEALKLKVEESLAALREQHAKEIADLQAEIERLKAKPAKS